MAAAIPFGVLSEFPDKSQHGRPDEGRQKPLTWEFESSVGKGAPALES
jgi:hypothetical protein